MAPVIAGIVYGTQLVKLGWELVAELTANPGMTAEQVAARVEQTKLRATATVAGWRDARNASNPTV